MPTYTRNEDGTLTQSTPGGYSALVIDPDGSFEKEMAADYLRQNPPPAPAPVTPPPLSAQVSPADAAALNQPSAVGPTANPVIQPDKPPAAQVLPPLASSGPRATLVDERPGGGGQTMATQTESSTAVTTEGLDKKDRAAVDAAHAQTTKSEQEATDANRAATEKVSAQREAQGKQDFMSGYLKQVGALEAEDRYKRDYEEALAERTAAHKTKLDPTKAFGNERTSWAIVAGLEGALASLDEGISRLQKRGGAPPSTLISDMVERSIKMQEDERAQRIAASGENADVARENMLAARSDAHEAAAQVLEARKLVASSAEQVAFLDTEAAKQRLAANMRNEEYAKSVASRKSVQSRTTTQAAPTGPAKVTPGQEKANANLRELYRMRDTLRRAQKNGDLEAVVGFIDDKKASIKEATVGLSPGQQEAFTALNEWKLGNLNRMLREPNNRKTQDKAENNGVPKNDSAIEPALNRLDQIIAAEEEFARGATPSAPATPAEQY